MPLPRPPHGLADSRLLLPLVLLAGVAPYVSGLHLVPQTTEAIAWMTLGADTAAQAREVLMDRHVTGFRPLTVLVFAAGHLLGGLETLPIRLTALVLHGVTGGMVYLLARAWMKDQPRWIPAPEPGHRRPRRR